MRNQTKRYLKAHREGRLVCSVKSETHDRLIFTLHEIKKGYAYDFECFLIDLGFPTRNGKHSIHVGGMSKAFALNHRILEELLGESMLRKKTYDELLQKDIIVL